MPLPLLFLMLLSLISRLEFPRLLVYLLPFCSRVTCLVVMMRFPVWWDTSLVEVHWSKTNTLSHYFTHYHWLVALYLAQEFSCLLLSVSLKIPSCLTDLFFYSSTLICLMPMMKQRDKLNPYWWNTLTPVWGNIQAIFSFTYCYCFKLCEFPAKFLFLF